MTEEKACFVGPVIGPLPPEHPVGVVADGTDPALHLEHHALPEPLGAFPVGGLLVQGGMVEGCLCALLLLLGLKIAQASQAAEVLHFSIKSIFIDSPGPHGGPSGGRPDSWGPPLRPEKNTAC